MTHWFVFHKKGKPDQERPRIEKLGDMDIGRVKYGDNSNKDHF